MKINFFLYQLRERLLIGIVELSKPWYTRLFKKNIRAWDHSAQSLRAYPLKSLGRELADFLEREKLELLPKLEDHDVMHVLMHYKTTVVDEARMQFFLLGNRKRSLYAILCATAAIFLIPEHLRLFRKEFLKGRRCASIYLWDFRYLLQEPVEVLRAMVFRKNLGEEAPFIV